MIVYVSIILCIVDLFQWGACVIDTLSYLLLNVTCWCGPAVDAQSRYAFVKFYSALAAARALHATSGRLYVHGQHLKVRPDKMPVLPVAVWWKNRDVGGM